SRVQIRAGSVVLPMHHPISVVEEWSIIDNLSGGRIGISFASGWSPNDFALRPEVYANRKEELFCGIETVHQLWQGEPIQMRNGNGDDIHVRAFPKPLQATLPTWITSTSSPDTCTRAGKIGAHLLTALLRLSVEEIAAHIELYRHALSTHGFDPHSRTVTVMLHTYVHETLEIVRERVKKPLISYLRTYLTMFSDLARSILHLNIDQLTEQDKDALAQFAFERYFTSNGLFGTPATCLPMIKSLKMVGVNELACLIDFGLDFDTVMEGLSHLALLKEACTAQNL
ncbi:MAG TPA: MupA/Atu3671 family FMN-dependent luciferase-like monooxygenase, partial [Ktedonobacteraceae bacterium]|nr:MupA/Atu3671 family FMN-dependent luciferase-like monooxygenase [Ktedonobacteraceae bacterium]